MTSLAASSLGVPRGKLEPGAVADLVLFDPRTVSDRATLAEPHALSSGIRTVWVGGKIVFLNGMTTGATPGLVLRRAASATGRE
jgi:N-acyl-D-aspartate/D-glutamate deacylase